jgi:hypothetical protein
MPGAVTADRGKRHRSFGIKKSACGAAGGYGDGRTSTSSACWRCGAALICASTSWSFIAPPEQIPFLLAHATPHAVHLPCPQREGQAFWLDLAPCADFLRLRFVLQAQNGR